MTGGPIPPEQQPSEWAKRAALESYRNCKDRSEGLQCSGCVGRLIDRVAQAVREAAAKTQCSICRMTRQPRTLRDDGVWHYGEPCKAQAIWQLDLSRIMDPQK